MNYNVQIVGLACFVRDQGSRHVMLPDGRNPGDGIDPHFASIVVDSNAIDSFVGWDGDDTAAQGMFALPPCSITIDGADQPGDLDTSGHDGLLPELRRIAPDFEIDPALAQTIATLDIRRGTLTAYQVPEGTAIMSQLTVLHDGPVTVRVVPRDGSPERAINLKEGTEIALTNTGSGGYRKTSDSNGHFRIYEKLSARPVVLGNPPEITGVPPTPSHHVIFTGGAAAGLSSSCSNTGCCGG
jgi:hypothetical protein